MSPGHCSCPACGTTLRVRDRSFVGRQIDCPDCHVRLIIRLDDERQLVAERPQPERTRPESTRRLAAVTAPAARARSALSKKLGKLLHSPLVMAWALAVGVTAFLAILMLRPAVRFRPPSQEQSRPVATESADGQASRERDREADKIAEPQVAPPTTVAENSSVPSPTVAENEQPAPALNPTPTPPVPPTTETPRPVAVAPAAPRDSHPKPAIPVPVKIDVEGLLKQRLQGFVTRVPLSRQKIIEQLEEMLGASIHYDRDELGEKNLAQPVTITLEATTVGGVLKTLLDPAGWEFVIENDGIRLKPRQVAGTSS